MQTMLSVLVLALTVAASSALAGPYEEGVAAFARGEYAKALALLQPLAQQGDARAQFHLGVMYTYGQGVPRDYAEAFQWYRRAAEQGLAIAQSNLGGTYENGYGVPQDYAKAFQWYRRAAEQGLAEAQHNLGQLYRDGRGVPQDFATAAQWYRRAAEQGMAKAQTNIAAMYYYGYGVPQDYAEALQWVRRAAEQGFADAQANLGTMYTNGQGVPQNDTEAAQWYRRAAEQGHAPAQTLLGQLYRDGRGVPQDFATAAQWYRRAAEQGHAPAQLGLGILYGTGRGVPKDYVHAYLWLSLAATRSPSGPERDKVVQARDLVAQKMSPAQRARAQEMVQTWQPQQKTVQTWQLPVELPLPPDDVLQAKLLEVGSSMGWSLAYENHSEGLFIWRLQLTVGTREQPRMPCEGRFTWYMKRVGNAIAVDDPVALIACPLDQHQAQAEARRVQEEFKRRWLALVGPVTLRGPTSATHSAAIQSKALVETIKQGREK